MFKLISSLCIFPVIFSCGTAKTDGVAASPASSTPEAETKKTDAAPEEENYTRLVNLESDLPACEEKRAGMLVFVQQDSSFKSCSQGKWRTINPATDIILYAA